jgi:hypothetical protein
LKKQGFSHLPFPEIAAVSVGAAWMQLHQDPASTSLEMGDPQPRRNSAIGSHPFAPESMGAGTPPLGDLGEWLSPFGQRRCHKAEF